MAFQFYVTIEGAQQGTFKGDPPKAGTAGGPSSARITVRAFNYGVTTPHDPATGQATGKRQHSQVSFVKAWSAATPQLYAALCTNEGLKSVLFEFVEADTHGVLQVSHAIKLTNATVASMRFDIQSPAPIDGGTPHDLEEISLVFQKVEVVSGQASASDTWTAGGPHP